MKDKNNDLPDGGDKVATSTHDSSDATAPEDDKDTTTPDEAEPTIVTEQITPRRRDSAVWSERTQRAQQSQKPQRAKRGKSSIAPNFGQSLKPDRDNNLATESKPSGGTGYAGNKSRNRLPSPKELKKYLDQYTIGQETAKKHFSVAIYNHCVRMEDRLDRQEAEYAAMEFQEENSLPSK